MKATTYKHGKFTVTVTWDSPSDEVVRETARRLVDKINDVIATERAGE